MEIICEYSPIRIKKREKGEFLAGMEKALPVSGGGRAWGVYGGVLSLFGKGGIILFFR